MTQRLSGILRGAAATRRPAIANVPDLGAETLGALISRSADRYGTSLAVRGPGRGQQLEDVTYQELDERSARLRDHLVSYLRPGDHVVLSGRNSVAWIVAFFAISRAGAIPVPLDPEVDESSLRHILDEVRPAMVAADREFLRRTGGGEIATIDLDALPDAAAVSSTDVDRAGDDLAVILYSTGTTGIPKGVRLSHRNIIANVEAIKVAVHLVEDDCLFNVLPLHHAFPLTVGTVAPIAWGVPIELESRPGRVAQRLPEARPTIILGVPALYATVLRQVRHRARSGLRGHYLRIAYATNHWLISRLGINAGRLLFRPLQKTLGGRLRFAGSGGAALPREIALDAMTFGLPLLQGYGLSEASPVVTIQRFSPRKFWWTKHYWKRAGSVGEPLDNLRVELAPVPGITRPDIGEVVVEGPSVMLGYFERPDEDAATLVDGRLHTGDLGRFDRDGNLYIVGRQKLTVKTPGGEMVNLERVDRVLADQPEIAQACTIVEPGDEWKLSVIVFPSTLADGGSEDAVRDAIRAAMTRSNGHLRVYERPRVHVLIDVPLPETRLGKIRRNLIPAEFGFDYDTWVAAANEYDGQATAG